MAKFKIGDRVRVSAKQSSGVVPIGSLGVVINISDIPFVSWDTFHGHRRSINGKDYERVWAIREEYLELVEYERAWAIREEYLELVEREIELAPTFATKLDCDRYLYTDADTDKAIANLSSFFASAIEGANMTPEQWEYPTNSKPNTMSNISSFFKNMSLSADDKLLRELGLEDQNGEPTAQYADISTRIDFARNRAEIIEIAKKMKAEQDKAKK